MLRAEAAKVMAIVGGLCARAEDVSMASSMPAFFGAFIVAVIVFSMAFFVSDREPGKQGNG